MHPRHPHRHPCPNERTIEVFDIRGTKKCKRLVDFVFEDFEHAGDTRRAVLSKASQPRGLAKLSNG